jgi:catechol 2,3-dioxygenase-like lactoylglutathione lyase family enzyme
VTAAGLAAHELAAFVPSADLERARDFYAARLGLPVRELDDFACVRDGNGTMVRVTMVPGHSPAAHTILGWMVEDITAEVRALAGRGVVFTRYEGMGQDEDGVWTAPSGDRVAWFTDPDGNTLSLTQFG